MADQLSPDGSFTVSDDLVTVSRSIERKATGILSTCSIRSVCGMPVAVHITDALPNALPVDQIGFTPGYEPARGDATAEWVMIADTVPAETELVVTYGIRLPDADTVTLDGRISIEQSLPVDPGMDEPIPLVRGSGFVTDIRNGQSASTPTTGQTSDGESSWGDQLSDAGRPPATAPQGDGDDVRAATASPGGHDPGVSRQPTSNGSGTAVTHGDGVAASDASTMAATSRNDRTEPVGNADPPSTAANEGPDGADTGASEGMSMAADGGDTEATDAAGPATSEAASNHRADTDPAGTHQRARPADGDALSRSAAMRLRHVQSRMDDFAAYVDALEAAIDEHGPPATFLARIESEVEAVRTDLEAVQADLEIEHSRRTALERRVDDLETEHERMADRLDDLHDLRGECQDLREDHATALGDLQTETSALERRFEERHESLASTVTELETLHDALADIFGESAVAVSSEGE